MNRDDLYLTPRGPTVYAELFEIIDTAHADAAVAGLADVLPPVAVERARGDVRGAVRRAYLDGLRDGFVQGVHERAALAEEYNAGAPQRAEP